MPLASRQTKALRPWRPLHSALQDGRAGHCDALLPQSLLTLFWAVNLWLLLQQQLHNLLLPKISQQPTYSTTPRRSPATLG